MKETDLARNVVEWLTTNNWDVYQEVSIGRADKRADIVATRDHLTWIIECKMALSLSLLDQASYWVRLGMAHFVSIAIPTHKKRGRRVRLPQLVHAFLNDYGIGVLCCSSDHTVDKISELIEARFVRQRRIHHSLGGIEQYLVPEQKHVGTAGSAHGGYYTRYRSTMDRVKGLLKREGWLTMKEIMESISTHYHSGSARASLQAALTNYESDWCGIDSSQRPYRYYLKEKQEKQEKPEDK